MKERIGRKNMSGTKTSLNETDFFPHKEPFLKKPFDFLFASVGTLVSLPIWLLIVLAIFIEDGFPIIFSQIRLGLNGEKFKIYKFRSMVKDAENTTGPVWAYKKDYRITKVGKVLRDTKLDELPQLINILQGSMSFVGPRAERPELVTEIKKVVPRFDYRLKVRPGLTGIAQIHGGYNTHPRNKLRYDLVYIKNQSFWLDSKIIFATVWNILTGHWKNKEKRIDKLIGQVILESGVINEEQLNETLKYQEEWGGKVGEILIEKEYISVEKLNELLSLQIVVNSNINWASNSPQKDYLLGEIMLVMRVISADQLKEALMYQNINGGKIGQILRDLGYVSEDSLKDCLYRQSIARNESIINAL